ncbi:MAG: hypothetical protein CFE24_01435 [Flavobacterium sp. BFFFF2]|nr:MAG: hypothetical protein CFE24_01435 [Flavobacterium sp. BFFFF2]
MDDIGKLLLVLILGIPIWLILAVLYVFIRLLHNWLTKKGYGLASNTLIFSLAIFLAYSVYTAVYPSDGFYLAEFKDITLREAPKSAVVISKDASYPFFHGEYSSASLIMLSNEDYNFLLDELSNDKRIRVNIPTDFFVINELEKVMGSFKKEQIIYCFSRSTENRNNEFLYIGFLDDKKSIIISKCLL